MCESFSLFEALVNSRLFEASAILIAFTNISALSAKLISDPLENFDNDYAGGDDPERAKEYLEDRFLSLERVSHPQPISVIYTDFNISLIQPAQELLGEVRRLQ